MTDLAKLVVRLEAEIGKYSGNLEAAERRLQKFERTTSGLLDKVQDRIVAFFTVQKIVEWGDHILETGDRLAKFSQTSGIAVEELSRLEYALRSSGVQSENTGKLLKELNQNISDAAGNAKGEAAAAFKALGIEVRDSLTGNLKDGQQILLETADRFATYQDGANKSALATALLGKAGAEAVPFLNQGADGIRRLYEEADRLGATMSGNTARAAEEFNDHLARAKTLLVDGIGNAIAEELLPALNSLAGDLESNVDALETIEHVASVAATGLKLLASAGLIVGTVFDRLGEHIGALTAANVQFFSGNFREAGRIVVDYYNRTGDDLEKFQERLAGIWREGGDNVLREVKVHAQRIKEEAPNLAATKEIEKAAADSLKKLSELNQQFAEQVATFGLGENEALRYRLTVGNLSDEVTKAGAAGREMRDSILGQADALQKLKDTKEIEKALADVNAQIESLRGNAADAAVAQFDAKNFELVTKLRREGNEEGQKQLDTLLTLIVAQADYNELNEKAQRIQADLAIAEERLNNSREAGALTDLAVQQQLGSLREKAARQLEDIATQQEKIVEQTGNPQLEENLRRFQQNIANLKAQTDVFAQSVRKGFEESFNDELFKAIKGVESLQDAFGNFIQSVADQLLKLATQQLGQQIFGAVLGSGTQGGGYLSALVGAFGGGRAAGGPVLAGTGYTINEGTRDRERFVPSVNGRIEPAKAAGGMQVNQTFVMQVERGGTVSRQTQLQVGATAARGLADAQRRNG